MHFIIGGDRDGMINIQKLADKLNLNGRIILDGGLSHEKRKDILIRGHILLKKVQLSHSEF